MNGTGAHAELIDQVAKQLSPLLNGVAYTFHPPLFKGGSLQVLSYYDDDITFLFVEHIDHLLNTDAPWWSYLLGKKSINDHAFVGYKGLFVSNRNLRQAILDQTTTDCPVHVVGCGLPPSVQALPPADSVTRRITKEVYGREKSFFLAPVTGHVSDNTERLIRAYNLFRQRCDEEVTLLIGGPEKEQPRSVRRAIRKSPHRSDISFLPELSTAEYWKVYSSARAILYPSLSTRFPVDILQAWHARVPVLATDNDVLKGAGALVRGEDFKSVAEGMIALVTTPFLASGLVDNGTRRLADFTWNKVAERVAGVLRNAAPPQQ